jgi:hypothetical protein
MRKKSLVVLAATLSLVLAGSMISATASPLVGAGGGEVICHLPDFPTLGARNIAAGGCSGSGALAAAGVTEGSGNAVVAAGVATISNSSAAITYNESCVATEPFPETGIADGTLVGAGLTAVELTPTPVTRSGNVAIPFHWQRVGVVAIVTTGGLSGNGDAVLTLNNGDTVTNALGGVAVGLLIPLGVPAQCGHSGDAPLDVLVPFVTAGA